MNVNVSAHVALCREANPVVLGKSTVWTKEKKA